MPENHPTGGTAPTPGVEEPAGQRRNLDPRVAADRELGGRIGPEWPLPSSEDELAVGTPAGAAYDLGRLNARLVAHAGLAPLVAGGYFAELRETGREERGVWPTPADHGVPASLTPQHHWMRTCLTAALGAGAAAGLETLDDLTAAVKVGFDSEEEADVWAHAFYPRDEMEERLENRWPEFATPGDADGDGDFDRDGLSAARLEKLIADLVRPAEAFAAGVRALMRDAGPHLLGPFDLGRALAALEYPPGCWRTALAPPFGTRWPLERRDLHRDDGSLLPAEGRPEPKLALMENFPQRVKEDAAFRRDEYLAELAAYPDRFADWQRGEEARKGPPVGKRRRAFYPDFPLVPAVGLITVGPYEVQPEPADAREVTRLWRELDLPPGDLGKLPSPAPASGTVTDRSYRLDATSHAALRTFCDKADAVVRAAFDPTRPPHLQWDDVRYDPAAGRVYRLGHAADLRGGRGNNMRVFKALLDDEGGRGVLPVSRIADNWEEFRFNKTRAWSSGNPPGEDALDKFAERLTGKLANVRLRVVHENGALELRRKPLTG